MSPYHSSSSRSHRLHSTELSVATAGAEVAPAQHEDNRVDNRQVITPRPRHQFNSQDYCVLHDNYHGQTSTVAGEDIDNTHLEDVGRAAPLCHQRAERVGFQQKHCIPFSLCQHQTQASPSGLPLARTPSNGDTRTGTTTLTVVSHVQPDVTILSYNQLLQVERKRLQALLPPAIPLVPREKPSKALFLERLIPRRRVRDLEK